MLPLGRVGLSTQTFNTRISGVAQKTITGKLVGIAIHGSIYNANEWCNDGDSHSSLLIPELLTLYQREGISFVNRLRGEFSLAIWDGLKEVLYLVSDPFRVHPIFYYENHGTLVFASKMKSLLVSPLAINRKIHLEALVDFVASSAIPTPQTIFQHIKKLPPGHILTYKDRSVTLAPYWTMNFMSPDSSSEAALAERLRSHFYEASKTQYEWDRGSLEHEEIGAFLSGGIDSSTVTGVLTQIAQRPIKTFTVSFQEESFNEGNFAEIASKAFGSKHHNLIVTPQDAFEVIPILAKNFDEPFGNASAIPTFLCARNAFNHGVKVLYAGDGGDELFAGNERYILQRLFDYYKIIPEWFRESLCVPAIFSLAHLTKLELFEKAKKYIKRAKIPYPNRLWSYGIFEEIQMDSLFVDDVQRKIGENYNPYHAMSFHYSQAPACVELDRQLFLDLQLSISDNDLFKVSRMTEVAGIEVRYPFLDKEMANFSSTVPAHVKMRGRTLRSFFKSAYADFLPQEILKKKKHGFGLPIQLWLYQDKQLREMCLDLILSDTFIERGFVQKKALMKVIEDLKFHESSIYGTLLWNFMVLELWFRENLDT